MAAGASEAECALRETFHVGKFGVDLHLGNSASPMLAKHRARNV
jgi:hypothetical protein